MKYRILYSLLLLAGSFLLPACTDSDDEAGGSDTPPAGALPAEEFTLNTLPAEPYAEDAIRIVAADPNAQFNSLELMGDGYYLLTFDPIGYPASADEAGLAKGKRALPNGRTAIRTRGTRDENGTLTSLEDGLQYGRFTKLGNKKYGLNDGAEIDLQEATGSNGTVTYKSSDGRISTVYVHVFRPTENDATESICHTWEANEDELWLYLNGLYVAHGKQVFSNDMVHSSYKAVPGFDFTKDEFFDSFANSDDEYCYKVVFTNNSENGNGGTYICFYLDGDWQVTCWNWKDESKGTLHWYDPDDDPDKEEGYVTVRFAGNQMRVYEDYSFDEDGEGWRLVAVSTMTNR